MKRSILKPILFGVLFGAAAFFAPFFLLKVVLFILLVSFIFRLFWWKSGGWHRRMHFHMAYADKVRGMTDEEYADYKSKVSGNDCYGSYDCCGRERKNETRPVGGETLTDKK